MKILKQDLKQGFVHVKAENMDDLWALYSIIQNDDLVSGETERKLKIGGDDERNAKVVRKKMYLKIKVTEVEFSKHTAVLRISGIIIEGPEDISLGSHHTLSVEPGMDFKINKEWKQYELDKLNQAKNNTGVVTIICVFDREDALFAKMSASGIEKMAELKGQVAKKDQDQKSEGNFYKEIFNKAKEIDSRMQPKHFVFGSPGFFKEYLQKEIDEALGKKSIFASCSSVDMNSVLEVVKRPELKQALKDDSTAREENLVEELMIALNEEKASIGFKEVTESVNEGKCKKLIVSENLIMSLRQENKFKELEQIMKTAESSKTSIHIIASENAMKKIDGISGVASINRW